MLLPSVPMLVSPLIANADARSRGLPIGEAQIANAIATFLMSFWASAALSIILGFLLEKWRHGTIEKLGRAISYGVQILIINFVIVLTIIINIIILTITIIAILIINNHVIYNKIYAPRRPTNWWLPHETSSSTSSY